MDASTLPIYGGADTARNDGLILKKVGAVPAFAHQSWEDLPKRNLKINMQSGRAEFDKKTAMS